MRPALRRALKSQTGLAGLGLGLAVSCVPDEN